MIRKNPLFFLFALFIVLYLAPLQVRPLFIQDETRYAEVPREMIANGDWVVPRINGVRYFEKPVMAYWLTATSLTLFGDTNFAVRFPSSLATGLTALLIFFLCSHCFPQTSRLPWLSAFIYLTSLGVNALGTFAVPDPSLTLFLSTALIAFFLASESQAGSNRERIWLFAAGLLAGCAFLTKGFLAFAIPVAAAAPYLLFQHRGRDLLRMLWLPGIGAALVSLPWTFLIYQREADFWHYFFWNEHVRRFLSDSAQHAQPFWYFLLILPAMFMPWTLLLPAAITGIWKKQLPDSLPKRLLIFCLCWFLFPFLFFSVSKGKLVTYILPCFPPLSILFAFAIHQILQKERNQKLQWGIGTMILLITTTLLVIAGLHVFGPEQLHLFHYSWKWLLLCSVLMTILLILRVAFKTCNPQHKVILFALSFSTLLFTAQFTIPTITLNMKAPGALITRHAHTITSDTYVLSGEEMIRAVCWYLKRNDVYLVERSGELAYGIEYNDTRHRKLRPSEAGEFIRKHPGKTVLIAEQEEYSRWQPVLPSPVSIDSTGSNGYLLIQY